MQDDARPKRKSTKKKREPPKLEVVILNPQECLPDATIDWLIDMTYEAMKRRESNPPAGTPR